MIRYSLYICVLIFAPLIGRGQGEPKITIQQLRGIAGTTNTLAMFTANGMGNSPLSFDGSQTVTLNATFPNLTLNSGNGAGQFNNINFAGSWANGSTALGGNNIYATIDGYGGMFFKTVPGMTTAFSKVGVGVNDQFTYVGFGNNNIGSAYSPASGSIGTFTAWNAMYNNTNFITGTNKAVNTYNEWLGGLIIGNYINNTAIIGQAPAATINAQYKGTDGSLNQSFYDLVFHINTNRLGTYSFHQPVERFRIKDNGNVVFNGREEYDFQSTLNMSFDGFWRAYNNLSSTMQLTNVLKASDATITNTTPKLTLVTGANTAIIQQNSTRTEYRGTTIAHDFFRNGTYIGGFSNIGVSSVSVAANYPAYNLVNALQTGWDGSSTAFDVYVSGKKRFFFENNNDLNMGLGETNEFTSKFNFKVWNGTTTETMTWGAYGGAGFGIFGNVPTGREYEFRVNNTQVAAINATGVGFGTTAAEPFHAYKSTGVTSLFLENAAGYSQVRLKGNSGEILVKGINGEYQIEDITNSETPFYYGYNVATFVKNNLSVITLTPNGFVGINNGNSASTLDVGGSFAAPINPSVGTNPYTLNDNDYVIRLTVVGASVANLPSASTVPNRMYIVINTTGTTKTFNTNYLDFTNSSVNTIPANSSITVHSNGTNWYRIQ